MVIELSKRFFVRNFSINVSSTVKPFTIHIFILPMAGIALIIIAMLVLLLTLQYHQKRELMRRIAALRAQINPHFIANSMNAIESMVNLGQRQEASRYLIHFSRLSQQTFNSSFETATSLAGELETLKHFLALEQLRFRDKMDYKIVVGKGVIPHLLEVPAMVMRPYVENAIWYGLKPKASAGKLTISLELREKRLLCCIEDDGIGRGQSRDLQPVRKVRSAKVQTIDLKDAHGNALGTRVELYLPLKKREK